MRFARLQGESEGIPVGLQELVDQAALDFVQLDYPRPRLAAVQGAQPAALPEFAAGFADALRLLTKTLFLEPEFRVMASPGWASAYECVERAAGPLIAGGCGDVLVSAVRGSNLLPILEMLDRTGVDLQNADTGAPWRALREPILAADLQLGAGPLVTALAEGARILVGGCFDGASPATASAVARFGWAWTELNRLAGAETAARAAAWRDWEADAERRASESWMPPCVELEETGRCTVLFNDADAGAAERLQDWLRGDEESRSVAMHADVRADSSAVKCRPAGASQVSVEGADGAETDACWRLEVLYQSGYACEAMVEFVATSDSRLRRQIAELARAHLQPAEDAGSLLTVEELHPLSGACPGWLHLAYQSKSRSACQQFADQTLKLVSAHRPLVRLASGAPVVHVHCGLWPARVPRDAVDIAVETRSAKEWV